MTNEQKIERLTDWLNEQGMWADNYVDHVDNISNAIECCFERYNLHYGELDEEIQDEVKEILENMDESDILDYCEEPDIYHGIRCRTNEIWSLSVGEVETQITGMYCHETESHCVYTDLCKGLTPEQVKEAEDNCDYYISNDYLYSDHSYDRFSVVLDVDRLLKEKSTLKIA